MLKLICIASCLVAVSQAFMTNGIYTIPGTQFRMDFNQYTSSPKALENICNSAVMQNGGRFTDRMSDVMGNAVRYMAQAVPGATQNPSLLGTGSAQWSCLINSVTNNGMNPGNAANGVSDYMDTVAELPINRYLSFAFNPCEMIFCGEPGLNPMTIAARVAHKLRMGMPLGGMAKYFGQFASQVPVGRPMFGFGGAATGMGGANTGMGGANTGMPTTGGMPAANPMMTVMQNFQKMMAGGGATGGATGQATPNMGGAPATGNPMMDMFAKMKAAMMPAATGGNPMMDMWKNMMTGGSTAGSSTGTQTSPTGTGSNAQPSSPLSPLSPSNAQTSSYPAPGSGSGSTSGQTGAGSTMGASTPSSTGGAGGFDMMGMMQKAQQMAQMLKASMGAGSPTTSTGSTGFGGMTGGMNRGMGGMMGAMMKQFAMEQAVQDGPDVVQQRVGMGMNPFGGMGMQMPGMGMPGMQNPWAALG